MLAEYDEAQINGTMTNSTIVADIDLLDRIRETVP